MPAHPRGPRPLGNRARAVVDETLIRLHTVDQLATGVMHAAEYGNYQLVVAKVASIHAEIATIRTMLGNAALGRY